MKTAALILGAIGVLLGGLWMLQGLGMLELEPILCVAACEPVRGPSLMWVIAGLVVVGVGASALFFGLRRG